MRRHELTDEQFKKIESMLPGRKGHVGVTAQDNRIFINGVLWIFKTGAPWRDLPERYGHWKNVHRRFSRWSKAGIFDRIFRVLSEDADMEAARREKRFKNWCRKWKINVIEQLNPAWQDLYEEICI